jgi:hypothetical protein
MFIHLIGNSVVAANKKALSQQQRFHNLSASISQRTGDIHSHLGRVIPRTTAYLYLNNSTENKCKFLGIIDREKKPLYIYPKLVNIYW